MERLACCLPKATFTCRGLLFPCCGPNVEGAELAHTGQGEKICAAINAAKHTEVSSSPWSSGMISEPSYGNVSTVRVEGEPQGARNVNIKLGVKAVAGTPSSMLSFAPCEFCSCGLAEVAVSLPRSAE